MMWQIIILVVLLIPILAIVIDSQIGRALAKRLEGRGLEAGGDIMAERLAFLEGEVERLSDELKRLDESDQFVQKLLTERAGGDDRPGEPPKGEPDD